MRRTLIAAAAVAAVTAHPVAGDQHTHDAEATLKNRDGAEIGAVTFDRTASGLLHVKIQAERLPQGAHGVHVHEIGDCSAGDFTSAGGHLAGDAAHGIETEGGPHPGDLPNGHVHSDGLMEFEVFHPTLTVEMMMDADGAAVIVHAGADDYSSQPSGAAGDRIACGVVESAM